MDASIVGAAIACGTGILLAVGNDKLTRAAYRKQPAHFMPVFALRQAINIAYLAALYFLAPALPWGAAPLLIGGALGVTVPSVCLASRFARQIGAQRKEPEDGGDTAEEGKEREANG